MLLQCVYFLTIVIRSHADILFNYEQNSFSEDYSQKYNLKLSHSKCNMEMVELFPLELEEDLNYVKSLLKEFQEKTGSLIAEDLLRTWPAPASRFVKV